MVVRCMSINKIYCLIWKILFADEIMKKHKLQPPRQYFVGDIFHYRKKQKKWFNEHEIEEQHTIFLKLIRSQYRKWLENTKIILRCNVLFYVMLLK